jgi:hypothetical protein
MFHFFSVLVVTLTRNSGPGFVGVKQLDCGSFPIVNTRVMCIESYVSTSKLIGL